jgi:hypothetical protein
MMRMKEPAILALCGAALAVSGCGSMRDAAGLTKRSPDEFAVSTKAPLVIPPDFNLRPPMPGAAPVNQTDPGTAAQQALFNSSDAATVAGGMRGNYSTTEKMLLANAGVQNSDPSIRTELKSDTRTALQGADASFTDRVLGTKPSPASGQPINADAEVERRAARAQKQAAKPKQSSGGWFDWF